MMENSIIKIENINSAAIDISAFSKAKVRAYFQLMKPTIILLFVLTGASTMLVEGSLVKDQFRFWMLVFGMFLTAGSANAFNQYLDRDIDALMDRTKKKRPIPNGTISTKEALIFSWTTAVLSTLVLWAFGNAQAAFWGVFTIFYYVVVYTMWLKRSTPYNIVIGGAAGATAPLIGWAAATGSLTLLPWALFLIIFMWTPPHFWSLALCIKEEYAGVSVPMLPVVKGEKRTKVEILIYALLLLPISLIPYAIKTSGIIYLVGASVLGLEFIRCSLHVVKSEDKKVYWKNFGFSIAYLLALFSVLMLDAFIKI